MALLVIELLVPAVILAAVAWLLIKKNIRKNKMADVYSEQATKIVAQDYEMLRPDEHYGRRRAHYFEYVVPAGGIINDYLYAMKIPAGARILGGTVVHTSMGTDAAWEIGLKAFDGSGKLDIAGTVSDNTAFLQDEYDCSGGGTDEFANLLDLNYGYRTEKACWVVFYLSGATFPANGIIKGDIEIVVD